MPILPVLIHFRTSLHHFYSALHKPRICVVSQHAAVFGWGEHNRVLTGAASFFSVMFRSVSCLSLPVQSQDLEKIQGGHVCDNCEMKCKVCRKQWRWVAKIGVSWKKRWPFCLLFTLFFEKNFLSFAGHSTTLLEKFVSAKCSILLCSISRYTHIGINFLWKFPRLTWETFL